MRVKVKYEETVERTAYADIDEDEFLDWLSGWDSASRYDHIDQASAELGEDFNSRLQEFLEAAEDWAQDLEPISHHALDEGLGQRLVEVSLA